MKKTIGIRVAILGMFFNSMIFSQTEKTVLAFTKSIEQEKKLEYSAAIETILNLNDSTLYEINARLGWLYYKAGFKKKSIAYYKKSISMMPKVIEARYGFGFPAYLLEDYSDIIFQDKKILEIDPNNKTINGNLGLLYYENKEYKNAAFFFEKVVALYPFDYSNNLSLAWTYLKLGKNEEAVACFNTVLLYSPKDASAKEGLSYIKGIAPMNEKVLESFLKSYELANKNDLVSSIAVMKEVYDASSYFINLRLGWLCYLAGLQTESASYYKIASELKPNSIEAKFGCALPAEMMGNKNDLKLQYDLILEIDPQNTIAHYKLGVLDYDKKEYQSALTHFDKIVSLYPSDVDGLLMLGWANYQLGKISESKIIFNKVLCLSPNNASALQGLGVKMIDNKPAGL